MQQRKERLPKLVHIMTPFPFAIEMRQPLAEARRLMNEHKFHHLPVVDDQKLVGVISDRDIKWALDPLAPKRSAEGLLVEHVFRREPFIVDLHSPLEDVLQEMGEKHIGSALVTKNGKLAGIFTLTDVCRHFADLLRELAAEPEDSVA